MTWVRNSGGAPLFPPAPLLASATIPSSGTVINLLFSVAVAIGAGGSAGFVLSMSGGASAMTYSSGSGSTTLVYSLGRTVNVSETGTLAYTQPTNGIEAVAGGADVTSFGSQSVTNNSTAGSGSDSGATTNQRYVRQAATGTGSGLDWTNATTALPTTLVRDTTYWVADGAYAGRTFSTAANGTQRIRIKKATAGLHGTETGWDATFGDGQATYSNGFFFTTDFWTVDGSVGGGPLDWFGARGFKITETGTSTAVIRVGDSSNTGKGNTTITHCELIGNPTQQSGGGSQGNDGISWYGGSGLVISYCHMRDFGRCHFFHSGANSVIEYNTCTTFNVTPGTPEVHAEIASIWDFSTPSQNVTFRYNLFTACRSTGGLMCDATGGPGGFFIYGNVFYRDPAVSSNQWTYGNGVIGGWSNFPTTGLLAYNNTFVNIKTLPFSENIFGIGDTTGTGQEIRNNLFYDCADPGGLTGATVTHNHFILTPSIGSNTSSGGADPFVNYPAFDFRIGAATPAGTTLGAPYNTDPFGNTRGADGVFDRGAYEKT